MGVGPLAELVPEMRSEVAGHAREFPMGIEEAKRVRLKLMEERKRFVKAQDGFFERYEFSLCEH